MKHTQGPWKVYAKQGVPCDNFDGAETETAYFLTNAVTGFQDRSEQAANVALIATAPELLEAAKEAQYQFEVMQIDYAEIFKEVPGLGERIYLAMLAVRQAVAKAEGKKL